LAHYSGDKAVEEVCEAVFTHSLPPHLAELQAAESGASAAAASPEQGGQEDQDGDFEHAEQLEKLVRMGFAAAKARQALQDASGDEGLAVAILTSEADAEKDDGTRKTVAALSDEGAGPAHNTRRRG